jgi:hypothetical protein
MTPEQKNALNHMCQRIQEELDPVKFQRLVVEMLDLLEQVAPGNENSDTVN